MIKEKWCTIGCDKLMAESGNVEKSKSMVRDVKDNST